MKEMPPKKTAKERHQETRRHLFQIGVSAADQEHIQTGVRLAFEQIEPHVKELLRLKELLRPVNSSDKKLPKFGGLPLCGLGARCC